MLGKTGTDRITGFTGVAVGYAKYLTGCDQYCLQPGVKEGEWKSSHWFDETRIEWADVPVVVLPTGEKPGCDVPAPVI